MVPQQRDIITVILYLYDLEHVEDKMYTLSNSVISFDISYKNHFARVQGLVRETYSRPNSPNLKSTKLMAFSVNWRTIQSDE